MSRSCAYSVCYRIVHAGSIAVEGSGLLGNQTVRLSTSSGASPAFCPAMPDRNATNPCLQATPTLSDIPADALAGILRLAGPRATAAACTTCTALRAASEQAALWRDFTLESWCPTVQAGGPASAAARAARLPWRSVYRRWASGTPAVTLVRRHASASAGPRRSVNSLAFSAPSAAAPTALLSAADDGALLLWDCATGTQLGGHASAHGGAAVTSLTAGPGSLVASSGADNALAVWDPRAPLSNGPIIRIPEAHSGEAFCSAWLCDPAHQGEGGGFADALPRLASGGGDELVRVWDLRSPGEGALFELEGGSGTVYSLVFDNLASRLFAAFGRDVCLFDLDLASCTGEWVSTLRAHTGDVYGLALGSESLISAGDDGCVYEWARPPAASACPSADEAPLDEEPEPTAKLELSSWRRREAVSTLSPSTHAAASSAAAAPGAALEVATSEATTATTANPDGRGDAGSVSIITSLACLGSGPSAFLAGTWEGYVVHAAARGGGGTGGRIRPFGKALLREESSTSAAVPEVPVTALAASLRVVAVGSATGEVRFMQMLSEEEAREEEVATTAETDS